MAWTHYADEFSTADLTGTSKYIRFSPDRNVVLAAMRTWLVLYNPPAFTNLRCKLYGDRNGVPGGIIATSTNSFIRSDLLETEVYGAKEIYFTFEPKISLNSTLYYHFVLSADNYTYSDSSHLAWRKAWPDPIYGEATIGNLLTSSYMFALIGADL
jgi:hypothetical protein